MGRAVLLLAPSAAPCGCSLLARDRFWERSAKAVDLDSPLRIPPESILVQVVDKNSRRITLGEERDSRKGRQGYDWSSKVGCRGGGMQPFSRERGLGVRGSADACRVESGRCETHSAATSEERSTPHPTRPASRLRSPPLLHPIQGSRSRRSGSRGRWGRKREQRQRAVCLPVPKAHLKTSGSWRVPLVLSWGLRAATAGWRPAAPHPQHLPPPVVLEIETEAEMFKKVKSNRKNQDRVHLAFGERDYLLFGLSLQSLSSRAPPSLGRCPQLFSTPTKRRGKSPRLPRPVRSLDPPTFC